MSQPAKKTARERAQEAVDAKGRKIQRLTDKSASLRAEVEEVEHELAQEKALLAYLTANPLLKDDPAQLTIDEDE